MKNVCISIIVICLFTAAAPMPSHAQVPLPGREAPLFALPDLEGKQRSLNDYRGSVVLVVFWATWCASCTAELPALDRLHADFSKKGFSVLAVSLDGRKDLVQAFLKDKHLSLPVLMDSEKEASFDLYAVTGLPVAFLIDQKGMIVDKFIGEKNWDDAAVRRAIADQLDRKEKTP